MNTSTLSFTHSCKKAMHDRYVNSNFFATFTISLQLKLVVIAPLVDLVAVPQEDEAAAPPDKAAAPLDEAAAPLDEAAAPPDEAAASLDERQLHWMRQQLLRMRRQLHWTSGSSIG